MALHSALTYVCNLCKVDKHELQFAKSDNKRGRRYECKECYRAKRKNPEVMETSRQYENGYYQTQRGRLVHLYRNAKRRALLTGKEIDIDTEFLEELWVKQNGCCAKTGNKFVLETNGLANKSPYNPSVDRIDNTKGYTKDNVQLVTYHYNIAKSTYTEEQLIQLAKDILNGVA